MEITTSDSSFIDNFFHHYNNLDKYKSEKSDYWLDHAASVEVTDVSAKGYVIKGRSGFYPPIKNQYGVNFSNLKFSVRKILESWRLLHDNLMERILDRGKSHHEKRSLVCAAKAFDLVFAHSSYIDYDENSYRMDHRKIIPFVKQAKDLRLKWHFSKKYEPSQLDYLYCYFYSIITHFQQDINNYIEIGPGTGNFASWIYQHKKAKIFLVDLPETLLISTSFLKQTHREIKILFPHQISGHSSLLGAIDEYDVFCLTPSQVGLIPETMFDTICNFHSFQEMTTSVIKDYFDLIRKISLKKALFVSVNRVEKVPSKDSPPIRSWEFPWFNDSEVLVDEVSRIHRLIQSDAVHLKIERLKSV